MKDLPLCECGHDNSEHCRTVESIHHCKHYGCDCGQWKWEGELPAEPEMSMDDDSVEIRRILAEGVGEEE